MDKLSLEELHKRYKKPKKPQVDWEPQRPKEDLETPPFVVPSYSSKNGDFIVKNLFSHILYFIRYTQRKRFKNGQTVIEIPRENNHNLKNWNSAMGITRAIENMIKIGLIAPYNEDYSYKYHRCKSYVYFVENEQKILDYCEENNIEIFNPDKSIKKPRRPKTTTGKLGFSDEDVIFSPNLNFPIPEGMSKGEFEDLLLIKLKNNYPQLSFFQEKVREINEKFYRDYPEFELSFRPHFKWDKNKKILNGIGIRVTNHLCNKSKKSRSWIKKRYKFTLSEDIKSSVPRFNLSINKGEWIDNDIDIYELINNEFEPDKKFTKTRREVIKQFHMNCYFSYSSSDRKLTKDIWRRMDRSELSKTQVDDLLGRLRSAIKKVEGNFWGSEIFYVESCVVIMTLYDLLNAGIKTWIVYDCFYSVDFEDKEFYSGMIKNQLKYNFEEFIKREKRFEKSGI